MNKHVMVALALILAAGLAIGEETAEKKVNPKVTELLAKIKGDIENAKPKFPENATEDQKKAQTETHAKLQKFAAEKLLPLCTNPVIAKEVLAQNTKKATLDEVKKIDEQWQKAEEELPIIKEKLTNPCAEEIKRAIKELKVVGETFVMDNLGANVGQNELTSDYWQGDEPKWKNSYNEGKGGVDISEPKLDKSTNVVDQKVSLPIISEEGSVVGAICFGIRSNDL